MSWAKPHCYLLQLHDMGAGPWYINTVDDDVAAGSFYVRQQARI